MRIHSIRRITLPHNNLKYKLEAEKISLYTFRHTFATMLLEERENPKIVASLMGHKKVSTTLDIYSHVINKDVYEKTAHTLDGVFKKFNSGQSPSSES